MTSNKTYKVHCFINEVWTYPICTFEEGRYFKIEDKEPIDAIDIYWVDIN
jgi:hypothetical protein